MWTCINVTVTVTVCFVKLCWFQTDRFWLVGFCLVVGLGVMAKVSSDIVFVERGWIV